MIDISKKIKQLMFDKETGEYVGPLYEGDKVMRRKSEEYLKSTVEFLPSEQYVKKFSRVSFELASVLSGKEFWFIEYLSPYLRYESGILAHSNGKHLTRAHMAEETKVNIKTIDRLLGGLKDKKVLSINKSGREVQYFMNPYIFMRGQRINKTLYEMFKNSRWAKMYPKNGLH